MHEVVILTYYCPLIDRLLILRLLYWLMYSNVQNLADWSFFHVEIHNLHQPVNILK